MTGPAIRQLLCIEWLRALTADAMELAGPAPLCIENHEGQAQVGWILTGLCQTQTLKHFWKAWNDVWCAVPTGALWVCGSHGWPYLLGNWTGCCTQGWPFCQCLGCVLLQLVLLLWFMCAGLCPHCPRNLHGRRPGVDCVMRNLEGVDCRVNRGSLASLSRRLGN